MNSQSRRQIAAVVLMGLTLVAVIEYGTIREAYSNDHRVSIEGLSFEEIILLDLDKEQVKRLAEINNKYYDDVLTAYYENSTKESFEDDIQALLVEKHNRMLRLLNEDQKDAWEKSLSKLIDQVQECGQVHGSLSKNITNSLY